MRLRPGFAMEEAPEDPEEELPQQPTDAANFGGLGDEEARKVWEAEHLCLRCLLVSMCKIGGNTHDSLTTITRCLPFIPAPK